MWQFSKGMLQLLACRLSGPSSSSSQAARLSGFRVDRSRVPRLDPADLEEKFVRGGGPGGQAVNKTANAVFLKHLPTGLWVKCHETRSLDRNRELARQHLVTRLDNLLNGEESVEAQQQRHARLLHDRRREETRLKYEARRAAKLAHSDRANHTDGVEEARENSDLEAGVVEKNGDLEAGGVKKNGDLVVAGSGEENNSEDKGER